MTSASSILAATLGRVSPKYRTLGQWAQTYSQIVEARPIGDKTKANRRSALGHITAAMGERTISKIRPHEVAAMIHSLTPQTAKRVLMEARDLFGEAVNYAWLDRNPAAQIKAPVAKVQRHRLTLDQWQLIHAHAKAQMQPWVSRMLVLALVTGQRRSDLRKMLFDDIWDGYLHVEQEKTGARLAIPIALRLDAIGVTIEETVEDCRSYAAGAANLLRKHNGYPPCAPSLSARFEDARDAVMPQCRTGLPTSLHECRSLSERLYRAQGINTMVPLGHKSQAMTDLYNDDRGLSRGAWQKLAL